MSPAHIWRGVIEEYRHRLPVADDAPVVTLGEGGTPLVPVSTLSRALDADVWVKVEGMNPTGSFKDRGMTMAMTKVAESGASTVVCASTGNTSASAAAYAVAAGLQCVVVLPQGKIAAGKLAQAIVHGARLVAVDGNFDDCLRIARGLAESYPVALVNSVNTYRLQGQKTAAFEVVDTLGDAPDVHVLPVGNAGNISAYWMGYNEYAGRATAATMLPGEGGSGLHVSGETSHATDPDAKDPLYLPTVATRVPRMWGIQAEGAAPFLKGEPIENPETIATAIRIGNPASWDYAAAARDDSHGFIDAVTDAEILDAQAMLAAEAGVFVEPASAASVAGLVKAGEAGLVERGWRIVCTVTGNGLKDTATALGSREVAPETIAPTVEAAVELLGL